MAPTSVRVEDGWLVVGDRRMPFLAGEVQFWRMAPEHWGPALDRVVELGIPVVSTYLSWRRHESVEGRYEWGASDPVLDARRFLGLCADRGLAVILKPGPWICAEEPGGGYPEWMTDRTEHMALTAGGRLTLGYDVPFLHPVPSLHSPWYRGVAARWLAEVWRELGGFAFPAGPIVAIQLDNEPSVAFQDALYFSDYNPIAIERFRSWLEERYAGDADAWRAAWGPAAGDGFATAEPPRPATETPDALELVGPVGRPTPESRAAQHDWTLFLEFTLADHLAWLWEVHRGHGMGHLLPTVNIIPDGIHDVPLSHRRVREALGGVAAVGVDHYYDPPMDWRLVGVLARTAAAARAAGEPVTWAPEIMAGIWRTPGQVVDYPDPTPPEQAAWWGAAIAVGYQGLDFYMLADRENWQFAPVSAEGELIDFAEPVRSLVERARADPAVLRSRPVSRVTVLWSRADALDAYTTIGTMRQPVVPWARAERRVAYDSAIALTGELLRAGHVFELWDPEADGPVPPAGTTLLVPERSTVDAGVLARAAEAGVPVVRVGAGTDLAALGVPARLADGVRGGHDLAVPHRDDAGGLLLHVVQWGDVPPSGARVLEVDASLVAGTASGSWADTVTGEVLAPVGPAAWEVRNAAGHRVFRWRPAS